MIDDKVLIPCYENELIIDSTRDTIMAFTQSIFSANVVSNYLTGREREQPTLLATNRAHTHTVKVHSEYINEHIKVLMTILSPRHASRTSVHCTLQSSSFRSHIFFFIIIQKNLLPKKLTGYHLLYHSTI